MSINRASTIRLASVIAGLENHQERILHDREYAYTLTRNPQMVQELHAILCLANRLELLVVDAVAPARFEVSDIADGALRPPFVMLRADEAMLLRFVRSCIKMSPVYQIEITENRDIVLWTFVYDEAARTSNLAVFDSSISEQVGAAR